MIIILAYNGNIESRLNWFFFESRHASDFQLECPENFSNIRYPTIRFTFVCRVQKGLSRTKYIILLVTLVVFPLTFGNRFIRATRRIKLIYNIRYNTNKIKYNAMIRLTFAIVYRLVSLLEMFFTFRFF